jgi:signal transduction histidine kinase
VLAFRRAGELSRPEQATLAALGAHLGVALENARLGAAQRRFAAELADKVALATREVQALDRAKSAFVAVASHELRTPLTALRGFSELLAIRTFSEAEVRRFARVMQEETERLVRIVDDLLDLSRLDQGLPPPLRRTAVDPHAALLAAAAFFERQRAGLRIEVAAEGAPPVHVDPDALDRILRNLVGNAIKYAPAAPITLSARATPHEVEFVVEDRGPGIPPDALPRLFEPYFRVGDGASGVRGSGLGLAIVRALVEAHGGRVRVESAREIGTRVCFTMPRVP